MKISVITVVKNDIVFIEETLKSCIAQTGVEIEYIVVDGLSDDGTNEIINKYLNFISLYIRESDDGIYDAMNKGTKFATGDWIIFMNSGDIFCNNNSLATLDLESKKSFSVIACSWIEKGAENRIFYARNSIRYSLPTSHQALLIKTELVKKYGFDLKYRIGADYDLVSQILKGREFELFISYHILAIVRPDGFGRNKEIYRRDYYNIILKRFGIFPYLKYRLNEIIVKIV